MIIFILPILLKQSCSFITCLEVSTETEYMRYQLIGFVFIEISWLFSTSCKFPEAVLKLIHVWYEGMYLGYGL